MWLGVFGAALTADGNNARLELALCTLLFYFSMLIMAKFAGKRITGRDPSIAAIFPRRSLVLPLGFFGRDADWPCPGLRISYCHFTERALHVLLSRLIAPALFHFIALHFGAAISTRVTAAVPDIHERVAWRIHRSASFRHQMSNLICCSPRSFRFFKQNPRATNNKRTNTPRGQHCARTHYGSEAQNRWSSV